MRKNSSAVRITGTVLGTDVKCIDAASSVHRLLNTEKHCYAHLFPDRVSCHYAASRELRYLILSWLPISCLVLQSYFSLAVLLIPLINSYAQL